MKATVNCFHAHQNHQLWLVLVMSALCIFAGNKVSIHYERNKKYINHLHTCGPALRAAGIGADRHRLVLAPGGLRRRQLLPRRRPRLHVAPAHTHPANTQRAASPWQQRLRGDAARCVSTNGNDSDYKREQIGYPTGTERQQFAESAQFADPKSAVNQGFTSSHVI